METLTYTDPKGQPQVFNVGDEAFITDPGGNPKYGKIYKWNQWWFIDSRGIEIKDLESGKYELTHMEPTRSRLIIPAQMTEQNKAFAKRNEGYGENMRSTSYGGKRSRRKSRRSRKSRKSRK